MVFHMLRQVDAGGNWEDRQRIRGTDTSFYKGWKIHIHDPGEFPEVSKKGRNQFYLSFLWPVW